MRQLSTRLLRANEAPSRVGQRCSVVGRGSSFAVSMLPLTPTKTTSARFVARDVASSVAVIMLRYCTYVTVIDVFFAVQYMCVTSVCSGDYCHSSGDWPGWGLAELIAFLLCKGGKSELTTNAPGTEVPVTGPLMQYLSWFQPYLATGRL